MYVADGNKYRFRLCEGRGGLETKSVSVSITGEEVAYLGQSRRIDFVKTGECGFEGSRLGLQQLDNDSDYSDITRESMAYLGNSSANLALSPLQRARSLKFGLTHSPLQFLGLYRPRRTFEHFDYDLARIVHLLCGRRLDKHAKQCSIGVRQEHGLNLCVCGEALEERIRTAMCPLEVRVRREERLERRELLQIRCRRTVADKDRLRV